MYIWEMDHLKSLKHILTNGKKKAYFEEFDIKKEDDKFKLKKEQSVLDLINSRPKVRLSKIEVLEKRLKDGKYTSLINP